MPFQNDDISINTYLGPGSAIAGDVRIAGGTRVEGDIDGNLESSGNIQIGEHARIRGNITAKSALVGGIVEGNIIAHDRVQLFSSAAVLGDIITHKLVLEDNVIFNGHCVALSDIDEYQQALRQWQDMSVLRGNVVFHNTEDSV